MPEFTLDKCAGDIPQALLYSDKLLGPQAFDINSASLFSFTTVALNALPPCQILLFNWSLSQF